MKAEVVVPSSECGRFLAPSARHTELFVWHNGELACRTGAPVRNSNDCGIYSLPLETAPAYARLVCRIAAQGDFAPRETNPRAYRFVAATKARESLVRVVEEERGWLACTACKVVPSADSGGG